MSDRIGPMAWGSQGAVFLGEDLMHTRDYSDDTQRAIDEEVEKILRAQEERAVATLDDFRPGLEAVAQALLEKETIDGLEVGRLVNTATGREIQAKTIRPLAPIPREADGTDAEATPAGGRATADDTVDLTVRRRPRAARPRPAEG